MKAKFEVVSTKIEKLKKAYLAVGKVRMSLGLAPNGDENKLFMKFVILQNAIGELEDKLTNEMEQMLKDNNWKL